jgi:signal transduction histidine kinase
MTPTTAPHPTLDDLRKIEVFADLPPEHLEWLATQMTTAEFEPGQIFIREDAPARLMTVVFEGALRGERESGGGDGRVYVAHAGEITGLLPYSRLATIPLTIRAMEPSRVGLLDKDQFPEMLHRMPALGARLVGVMSDRIRQTTRADQQREKLMALGKLSAGLAHELNNPAAAARRAAATLRDSVKLLRAANLRIAEHGLGPEPRLFLAKLECDWAQAAGPQQALDTVERSDREEALADWLTKHAVPDPWDLAAPLADAGTSLSTLQEVATHVPPTTLGAVLTRLSASFTVSRLIEEIDSSTGKISELVRVVKEYSYMDQMPEQEIDIHDGIENTLIMLKHKFKGGITIVRDYDRTLPKVCARGSELNQVWTNLIVNAVEAMKGQGELRIRTAREPIHALVEIIDDGPGVPENIRDRIFEPFFTTKPVGEGTGLGLDAVWRIVQNHHGRIGVESKPGETRFQVRIPLPVKPNKETS